MIRASFQFRLRTEAGEARKMRPVDVVRQAGSPITKGYYSQLENGHIKKPSDSHLERIATALGISKDDILLRRMPPESIAP